MSFLYSHDELEKIRQQYDFLPYPESDITLFPNNLEEIYIHSLVTPYYLRYQKRVSCQDKIILDAGCGSGMRALTLSVANPGSKIVGIDLSEKSVELARQRFAYHNLPNHEFYSIPLETVASLGYQFDLINCDEVLYLLPDPQKALQLFASVLSPQGIIRTNLHSYYQRIEFYRTQELFKFLGIAEEDSVEIALETVKDTLNCLNNNIRAKIFYHDYEQKQLSGLENTIKAKKLEEWIMTNYLLRGDKGYTIPEVFQLIRNADLDFLSMVNWRDWNVNDLFNNPENLPLFWQLGLESASEEEKLHIYELVNPVHRLLDFWCIKKNDELLPLSPMTWNNQQWQNCLIHLHPVLQNEKIKKDVTTACQERQSIDFSQYLKLNTKQPVIIDSNLLACLLPLWDNCQFFTELWQRWLSIEPLALDTLEVKTANQGYRELRELLTKLEVFNYILIELQF